MKTALILTTIDTPTVLALHRKYGPDVAFFIAGDQIPNVRDAQAFCDSIGATFLTFEDQFRRYPVLSNAIGPRNIQRRNFALLEAVRWGADMICTADDDNIPLDENYFKDFQRALYPANDSMRFNGLKASSPTGWFDVGQLLQPISPHRGFPYDKIAQPHFRSVMDVRVGVAAGICLGDPDISAVERIANGPAVHSVSEVLRSGVVTDPKQTWTVFNTQNTAFIRELAPAMFCPPGLGRYDDIVASLVTQRVMRERGLHVHFGKPFVWQQRNQHNLVKDLEAELWGMKHLVRFSEYLDSPIVSKKLEGKPVLEQVRAVYDDLRGNMDFSEQASEAALAFCDDVEKVL